MSCSFSLYLIVAHPNNMEIPPPPRKCEHINLMGSNQLFSSLEIFLSWESLFGGNNWLFANLGVNKRGPGGSF